MTSIVLESSWLSIFSISLQKIHTGSCHSSQIGLLFQPTGSTMELFVSLEQPSEHSQKLIGESPILSLPLKNDRRNGFPVAKPQFLLEIVLKHKLS